MENRNIRKFKIKTMDGRTTEFEMQADTTIEELKRQVESQMNVPIHRQRLIYKSRLLKEDQRLSDYLTKDDEVIHMMAMTEEQARSRSRNQERARANSGAQPNAAPMPNIFGQMPGPGSTNASGDPFAGIFGMVNNLMQGLNQPPGGMPTGATQATFSSGPIDLSQLLGQNFAAQSRAPASNTSDPNTQNQRRDSRVGRAPQAPHPVIIRISSRSGSRNRDVTRGAGAQRVSEENKNERSNSGVRNSTRIALPHPHIYETNLISNDLMGPGAAFPGPPLPPSGQPRNAQTVLGSYLTSLQFAISRLNPYIWRAGELLQREQNIINPLERAETQHLVNQTGRAMEQLGRALILSAHYYRDLTIGEAPGNIRVTNNPHPDFAEITERFNNAAFPDANSNAARPTASSGSSTITRTSTFASAPTGSASNRSQAQPPPINPFGNIFQSILTPENLNNVAGLLGNIGGVQGVRLPGQQPSSASSSSQPQQTSASNASGSRSQRDVHMAPAEETKDRSTRDRSTEEEKKQAETRQQTINSRFLSDFNNVASHPNNPLQQMFQSILPALGGAGGNPLTSPLGELFPEESGISRSFILKILINSSIQDLLAVMNGNYEVVTTLHPRTRDILLTEYMGGYDIPATRASATEQIAEELNSQMIMPEDVAYHVPRGSDPLKTAKRINKIHVKKLVDAILDSETNEQDSAVFLKRSKRILRWWVGEFIDGLKPHFNQQLPDVLKFIRGNVQHAINNVSDNTMQLIGGMFTDTIMKSINDAYNSYRDDRKREDEAEAREQGISLDELYQRRRDSERNSEMDVDLSESDPKIEEEPVNNTRSPSSAPTNHATPMNSAPKKEEQKQAPVRQEERKGEEQKVEEEKDPEIKQLLEMMEEDQSMLVVDPPSKRPRSRAYRALDVYHQQNVESGNSILECNPSKASAKSDATDLFRQALKEYGFRPDIIEKNLSECNITDEFVDHFKEVVKQEIRQRKEDPEYKEGQFPELDKI